MEKKPHRPRRILLPYDGGDAARSALRHVIRRRAAEYAEATVVLANAQHGYVDVELAHATHVLRKFQRLEGEAALLAAREALEALGIPHESEVVFGPPAAALAAAARRLRCDLVVMGAHRRARLLELFAPSLASRVSRASPVPVLVVPAEREAASRVELPAHLQTGAPR